MRWPCFGLLVFAFSVCHAYGLLRVREISSIPAQKTTLFALKVNDVWESRRKISRACLSIAKKAQEKALLESKDSDSVKIKAKSVKQSFFFTAFAAVAVTLAVRYGGRFTALQLVGLDLEHDIGLRDQILTFLSTFNGLSGEFQFLMLFGSWFVAKFLCFDLLTVILAISAGLIFDNVFVGAGVSVLCASLASAVLFLAARYLVASSVQRDIAKRPIVRAVDRVVQKNGFQTVFSLRVSPLLPLPVGAYTYLYALSSVPLADFLLGTSLGSVKPYLLDACLGAAAREPFLMQGTSSSTSSSDWWLAPLVVTSLLLATSFAAHLFEATAEEVCCELEHLLGSDDEAENEAENEAEGCGQESLSPRSVQGSDVRGDVRAASRRSGRWWFRALGFNLREQRQLQGDLRRRLPLLVPVEEAWERLCVVLDDEWRLLTSTTPSTSSYEEDRSVFAFETQQTVSVSELLESVLFTPALLSYVSSLPSPSASPSTSDTASISVRTSAPTPASSPQTEAR